MMRWGLEVSQKGKGKETLKTCRDLSNERGPEAEPPVGRKGGAAEEKKVRTGERATISYVKRSRSPGKKGKIGSEEKQKD